MDHAESSLDSLFRPRSVAVIGASDKPGSVGQALMRNLLATSFGGAVYPVNPSRSVVFGVHAYSDLSAVPEPVDLAVIATRAVTVPDQLLACVACGVKGALVISAGFSELGDAGRDLARQAREIVQGKLRLIGPNCLGVICPTSGLNASFAAGMALPGRVALLSQSGAICTSILDWSLIARVGFSAFVSVGTMIDVDFADLIDYFGDDAHTSSIVLYMESIGNVRSFLSAARAVARTKPIILVKSGRHEAGARAAASHTGAMAGSDAVFDAAIRRVGVLRVGSIGELFDMSEILAKQPEPRGPALGIVTNAGGPGVMAADAVISGGGTLAELSATTRAALDEFLPPYWSHANPIDVLGDATPETFRKAVEICRRDANIHGVLVLLSPQAMIDPREAAEQLATLARTDGKPILASWMGGARIRPGRERLEQLGIPCFNSPETAVGAFLNMVNYRRAQELLYETPAAVPDFQPDAQKVQEVIAAARRDGRRLLNEAESKALLAAYDLPVVPTVLAADADHAVSAAENMGFPVALKLLSATISHKSDAGGVQLNLADAAAVRRGFAAIVSNAQAYAEAHNLPLAGQVAGVSVQPMIQSGGLELIVGSTLDPQFGPVIQFGAGGILVEIFRDTSLALPPLNRTLARRLMERTKIYSALQGVRGQRGVDLAALETLLVRFSQLVVDVGDTHEIDINPLLAGPDKIVALDARVLLTEPSISTNGRVLAIQPYPNQYTAPLHLADGTDLAIRALRPEDEPLVVEHYGRLSEQTIRRRFFGMVKELSRDWLVRLCHLDYDRAMALAAVHTDASGPHIWGIARYHCRSGTGDAEFSIVVADPFQGHGVGWHLMHRLIEVAKDRGVHRLYGLVLRENRVMIDLMTTLKFSVESTEDGAILGVSLELDV